MLTGSNQSGQAKQRSQLSSSDTFTRRQGPTCACLFHGDSGFTCWLICACALSVACHNLLTPRLSTFSHSPHPSSSHPLSTVLGSITGLFLPTGNPPVQPVLGAPFQSTVITIIQQLSLSTDLSHTNCERAALSLLCPLYYWY